MLIIFLGVFIGLVLALTGAGGGILAVPLLVFFLHLPLAEAAPIGLLAIATSASIGVLLNLRHKAVRYRAAFVMSLIGIAFSSIGIWLANRIDNQYLVIIFSLALLYVAYLSFKDQNLKTIDASSQPACNINSQSGRFIWTTKCSVSLMLSGAIAGFLSGLIGVGGGFVIVPALQRLSTLSIQSVVSTSLAVTAILTSTVVAGNIVIGNLNWHIAFPFSLGAISGMILGTFVAGKINDQILKKAFAILALIVSLVMLSKVFL